MTRLSVNVNKVATLRNTRNLNLPSVAWAARLCLDAGALGITVHPRPDERHIRQSDVHELRQVLADYPAAEYNIEGNPLLPPFMDVVSAARPEQCTLVPDGPEVFTSDQGWAMTDEDCRRLEPTVRKLKDLGCRVSLFCNGDATPGMLARMAAIGADRIELYTEPFAAAYGQAREEEVFARFRDTAAAARAASLGVNAGHDLNLQNLARFLEIPEILEVSIGHALIAEALELGLPETVRRYLAITG